MDFIQFKEKDLFEWLKQNHFDSLVRSRNKFARWDCYDINSRSRIELKCRRKHWQTILIEKIKYDALIKKANDNLDIPLFIVSTPEGVFCWNLFEIKPKWEVNSRNPASTYWGDNRRVTKEVSYIDINESIKLS